MPCGPSNFSQRDAGSTRLKWQDARSDLRSNERASATQSTSSMRTMCSYAHLRIQKSLPSEHGQLSSEGALVSGPSFAPSDVGGQTRIFLHHTRCFRPSQHRHHQQIGGTERAVEPLAIA